MAGHRWLDLHDSVHSAHDLDPADDAAQPRLDDSEALLPRPRGARAREGADLRQHVAAGGKDRELQRIGDFVPVTVLDEPVVITRGLEGELRAFYNVCRHRAGQVALTKGNRKSLQCRYHGWTYGLDGCLRAAPEMEDTEGFSKDDFGLMPVRVDTWGPFVFVNLSDSAPPLADVLGAIPSRSPRPATTSSACGSSSGATT